MEHGIEIIALVAECERTKRELDEKNSGDPDLNHARSMAVYDLVTALGESGVTHAQAEAARLLNVSRTVTNRHVLKVRKTLEPDSIPRGTILEA